MLRWPGGDAGQRKKTRRELLLNGQRNGDDDTDADAEEAELATTTTVNSSEEAARQFDECAIFVLTHLIHVSFLYQIKSHSQVDHSRNDGMIPEMME